MQIPKLFPEVVAVTPQQAGFSVLGQTRQTTNNQLYQKRFKLPVTILGGKRMVLIEDIQKFIEQAKNQTVKKRRGSRTKAERLAAAAEQVGGA